MNRTMSKKERFFNWWTLERKLEFGAAGAVLLVLIFFWGNLLVEGIVGIAIAVWCLGKIYFRRGQWAFLSLAALWVLSQSLSILRAYTNSQK